MVFWNQSDECGLRSSWGKRRSECTLIRCVQHGARPELVALDSPGVLAGHVDLADLRDYEAGVDDGFGLNERFLDGLCEDGAGAREDGERHCGGARDERGQNVRSSTSAWHSMCSSEHDVGLRTGTHVSVDMNPRTKREVT